MKRTIQQLIEKWNHKQTNEATTCTSSMPDMKAIAIKIVGSEMAKNARKEREKEKENKKKLTAFIGWIDSKLNFTKGYEMQVNHKSFRIYSRTDWVSFLGIIEKWLTMCLSASLIVCLFFFLSLSQCGNMRCKTIKIIIYRLQSFPIILICGIFICFLVYEMDWNLLSQTIWICCVRIPFYPFRSILKLINNVKLFKQAITKIRQGFWVLHCCATKIQTIKWIKSRKTRWCWKRRGNNGCSQHPTEKANGQSTQRKSQSYFHFGTVVPVHMGRKSNFNLQTKMFVKEISERTCLKT